MAEGNEGAPPVNLSKREKWERLSEVRPRLIIEVGSSALGVGNTKQGREAFESGLYHDARYVCVDNDPSVTSNNLNEYSLGIRASIQDKSIVDQFTGEADQIWLKNTASIIHKKDWYSAIHKLLKPQGAVYIIDSYTVGLSQEKPQWADFFSNLGFDFEDLREDPTSDRDKHLLLEVVNKTHPGANPVFLKLTKMPDFSNQ